MSDRTTVDRLELPVTIPSPEHCSACVERLIEAVDELPGVGSVSIDPVTSTLRATVESGVASEGSIQAAVEQAGYEVAAAVGHATWRVSGLDCPDCA